MSICTKWLEQISYFFIHIVPRDEIPNLAPFDHNIDQLKLLPSERFDRVYRC